MKKGRMTVQEYEMRYAPSLFRAGKQIAHDVARDNHLTHRPNALHYTCIMRAGYSNCDVCFPWLALEIKKITRKHPGQ